MSKYLDRLRALDGGEQKTPGAKTPTSDSFGSFGSDTSRPNSKSSRETSGSFGSDQGEHVLELTQDDKPQVKPPNPCISNIYNYNLTIYNKDILPKESKGPSECDFKNIPTSLTAKTAKSPLATPATSADQSQSNTAADARASVNLLLDAMAAENERCRDWWRQPVENLRDGKLTIRSAVTGEENVIRLPKGRSRK